MYLTPWFLAVTCRRAFLTGSWPALSKMEGSSPREERDPSQPANKRNAKSALWLHCLLTLGRKVADTTRQRKTPQAERISTQKLWAMWASRAPRNAGHSSALHTLPRGGEDVLGGQGNSQRTDSQGHGAPFMGLLEPLGHVPMVLQGAQALKARKRRDC